MWLGITRIECKRRGLTGIQFAIRKLDAVGCQFESYLTVTAYCVQRVAGLSTCVSVTAPGPPALGARRNRDTESVRASESSCRSQSMDRNIMKSYVRFICMNLSLNSCWWIYDIEIIYEFIYMNSCVYSILWIIPWNHEWILGNEFTSEIMVSIWCLVSIWWTWRSAEPACPTVSKKTLET